MASNIFLLLGISLAWASGYLFIDAADHGLPPLTATAFMSAVAALVLLPGVAWGLRRPLLQPLRVRLWVPLVMALTAVAWPNLSVVLAERHVAPELAALVGTTVPIITFLLTVFVTRQTPYSHRRVLGVMIALAGMVTFVGLEELLGNDSQLHGILIMMSGGLVFALNGLLASSKARDLDECALAAWVVAFGAVLLAIAAAVHEAGQITMPPVHVMASVVAEGLLGMGLASLAYYVLLARAGPYFTSFYAFLVPLLGVLLAAVVRDEPLSPQHLAGLTIVLLGLWLLSSTAIRRPVPLPEKTPAPAE
jgi:drug/metabolite transporter (DMT)-like permease